MNDSNVVIRVSDVSKRFVIRKEKSLKERLVNFGRSNRHKEDFYALRNVTLDIERGTTVGLIGANGSGKSTLLKTIGGIIQPTNGEVKRRGRLAALLELGAGFHPDLTGRENVYLNAAILGLSRKQTDEYFDDIVAFSGIEKFIDTQVKFYSSGMYVRLAFSVAVHVNPDVLLVDEVLAVGDEPFQRKCMDRIRAFQHEGKTIVLVTHSLDVIGDLCDRAIVLESGTVAYDGEPGGALRRLRNSFEISRHEEQGTAHHPSATIRSVDLTRPGTTEGIDIIHSGDSLDMIVHVKANPDMHDWVVGMGIETPLGQVVFGTNTERLEYAPHPLTANSSIVFSLPELHLGAGQYTVHASFGTLEHGELFRIPQAAAFQVIDDSNNAGVLSIDASVAVRS